MELDWMEFVGLGKAFERARAAGLQVTVATTRIGKPGEDALVGRILKLEPDGVLVRHFGALMRCLDYRDEGGREFALCYRREDAEGTAIFLPLATDWDLEAAFLRFVLYLEVNIAKYVESPSGRVVKPLASHSS